MATAGEAVEYRSLIRAADGKKTNFYFDMYLELAIFKFAFN